MRENHEREQYFFDADTIDRVAQFAAGFADPCCLCAPRVGEALVARGAKPTILDIDERFADVPGFERFDLARPHWLGRTFGIIVCDPPFFGLSLKQLYAAVRTVAANDVTRPLLLCYLRRRADACLRAFEPFALQPTGALAGYETVDPSAKNEVEFFANFDVEERSLRRDSFGDQTDMSRPSSL